MTPRRHTKHRLADQWNADKTALAAKYFAGNTDAAQETLGALPYSCIPDWSDIDRILTTLTQHGWSSP